MLHIVLIIFFIFIKSSDIFVIDIDDNVISKNIKISSWKPVDQRNVFKRSFDILNRTGFLKFLGYYFLGISIFSILLMIYDRKYGQNTAGILFGMFSIPILIFFICFFCSVFIIMKGISFSQRE